MCQYNYVYFHLYSRRTQICTDNNDAGAVTYYNDPVSRIEDPHSNRQVSRNHRANHSTVTVTNDGVYIHEQDMDNVDYINEGFNIKSLRHEDSAILSLNTNKKAKSKCPKPETVGGQDSGSNTSYETPSMHGGASENSSHGYSVLQTPL